jgi:NTE family protein
VSYGARNVGLYDGGEAHLADFRVTEAELDLAAGRNLSVYGEARLGYRYRSGDVNLQTGSPIWPEYDYDTAQVYGRLSGDTLNNFNFPEHGWLASLEYRLARESLGGDNDFNQLTARANGYHTFGDGHVLGLGGLLETTFDGNADIQDRYRIGGFLYLSGYDQNSLSGQQAGVVSAVYYHRFNLLPFLSWYAGGSLEYGGVWENNNDIGDDGIAAGSAFLGADTPVGPVYFGYGLAEGGHNAIFFYLGRPLFR